MKTLEECIIDAKRICKKRVNKSIESGFEKETKRCAVCNEEFDGCFEDANQVWECSHCLGKVTFEKQYYTQLCVWEGALVGADKIDKFEEFMLKEFDVRAKYETEVKTLPDVVNGKVVPGTGNRNDTFFYIHSEDIGKFAVKRLFYEIKWWEDVFNNSGRLYTEDVLEKYNINW